MKIQSLAVIFIIIILPISIIVSEYIQGQMQTLRLQISYDSKLDDATYDAIKAFQLNTVNSSSSNYADSKLRDIEASVNTFFNLIATNFNMAGYNKDVLKDYVPALVYTMYDGFYIYSPYTNTLDEETSSQITPGTDTDIKYSDGIRVTGLKPYIYYSCRYTTAAIDVVITYSLDNYVTIQGTVNGNTVNKEGYVLDNLTATKDASGNITSITYRGQTISENEPLQQERVGNAIYKYIKINGVKYYQDIDGSWFSLFNGTKLKQDSMGNLTTDNSAYRLYEEAVELRDFIIGNGLNDLTPNDAVIPGDSRNIEDDNGNIVYSFTGEEKIFDYNTTGRSIEDSNSNFNQHRLAVIRYVIERNLSIAIANYNNYSTGIMTNFQMPRLKEEEWDSLLSNISMISFLQGLNIGGKVYNGYSVVNNNKNEEVVTEESIYIVTNDNYYHRITDTNLVADGSNIIGGVLNIDLERKQIIDTDIGNYNDANGSIRYYYPKNYLACYNCIVGQGSINNIGDAKSISQYVQNTGNATLANVYYTTLARERYSMFKVSRDSITFKNSFKVNH